MLVSSGNVISGQVPSRIMLATMHSQASLKREGIIGGKRDEEIPRASTGLRATADHRILEILPARLQENVVHVRTRA